jgi:hypothetical protein
MEFMKWLFQQLFALGLSLVEGVDLPMHEGPLDIESQKEVTRANI